MYRRSVRFDNDLVATPRACRETTEEAGCADAVAAAFLGVLYISRNLRGTTSISDKQGLRILGALRAGSSVTMTAVACHGTVPRAEGAEHAEHAENITGSSCGCAGSTAILAPLAPLRTIGRVTVDSGIVAVWVRIYRLSFTLLTRRASGHQHRLGNCRFDSKRTRVDSERDRTLAPRRQRGPPLNDSGKLAERTKLLRPSPQYRLLARVRVGSPSERQQHDGKGGHDQPPGCMDARLVTGVGWYRSPGRSSGAPPRWREGWRKCSCAAGYRIS